MKSKIKIIITLLSLLGMLSLPGFASAKQFGGYMGIYVPPTPYPVCPGHFIIYNSAGTGFNKVLGLVVTPGLTKTYNYGNLFTPGVHILGKYSSFSLGLCALPYKLVTATEIGTSLLP